MDLRKIYPPRKTGELTIMNRALIYIIQIIIHKDMQMNGVGLTPRKKPAKMVFFAIGILALATIAICL